jgi:hypothetical protein
VYRLDLKLADLDTHSRYLFLSTIAQTNCSAPADKLHSSIRKTTRSPPLAIFDFVVKHLANL